MSAGGVTNWGELRFDAETPAMTSVSFRVRTGNDRASLDAAMWIPVGMTPPDASPLDIGAALTAAGITPQRFLMIEIVLRSDRGSMTEVVTPRVLSVGASFTCPPIFG